MQAPYAEHAPVPPPRREHGLRLARLVTVLYFCACSLAGLLRLRRGGTPEAFSATLHVWYAEALIFGAAWGLAALLHGLFKGGGGGAAPRKIVTPAHASGGVLRALERDRGR